MRLAFIVDVPPLGTNNAYHTNMGRWYKDKKMVHWEEAELWKIKAVLLHRKHHLLRFPIECQLVYSYNRRPMPDIDSKIKPVLDLFQKAGIYKNDNEIMKLTVIKQLVTSSPQLYAQFYSQNAL